MFDNQLFALIIATVKAQEPVVELCAPILQAYQPQDQGTPSEPNAFIYKIGDHRLGAPDRKDCYNSETGIMTHIETEDYETTFQMSAISKQYAAKTGQLTSSDILNKIAYCLQSDYALQAFQAANVGIYNILDVRNTYFLNDRGQHQAQPSFDFTMTHKQIVSSVEEVVSSVEFTLDTV